MTGRRPSVTIVMHRDGNPDSVAFRMPVWLFRGLVGASTALMIFVVIGAVLYAPIARTAARVPGLNREISRLTEENRQVVQLSSTLDELESRYQQVRTVLGAEIVPERPPEPETDLVATTVALLASLPGDDRRFGPTGPSAPEHWPIDTIIHSAAITRGVVRDGEGPEPHPGVDIAVAMGTPIRAAGGGTVTAAGFEAEYGLFVQLSHPDGYQTMYGHASRLLVAAGAQVDAGQVIALSGTTGRSTAPHLHFETRLADTAVEPLATKGRS